VNKHKKDIIVENFLSMLSNIFSSIIHFFSFLSDYLYKIYSSDSIQKFLDTLTNFFLYFYNKIKIALISYFEKKEISATIIGNKDVSIKISTVLIYEFIIFLALFLFSFIILSFIVKFITNRLKNFSIIKGSISAERIVRIFHRSGMLFSLSFALKTSFFSTSFTKFVKLYSYVHNTIYIINTIILAQLIYVALYMSIDLYVRNFNHKNDRDLSKDFLPLIRKTLSITIFCITFVSILSHFGYNIMSFIATFGVASLAIGLAAQETLSNMISGFVIMLDRPFRIGDRIMFKDSDDNDFRGMGDIIEIGLRSTKILKLDQNMVVVPNSMLGNKQVINISYPNPQQKLYISVGISYGSNVQKAKDVIIAEVVKNKYVLKDPKPVVYFKRFGESSLDLYLTCWIDTYTDLWEVEDELHMAINDAFNANNIVIPFPHRTVYLKKEK